MNRWTWVVLAAALGGASVWLSQRARAAERVEINSASNPHAVVNPANPDPNMVVTPTNPDPKMLVTPANPDPKMLIDPTQPKTPSDPTATS